MREVAEEEDVFLIDMHKRSMKFISGLGPEASEEYYMNLEPGEHFAFPEGKDDNTHMQEKGAQQMALLAVKGMLDLEITPLVDCLKELVVHSNE